jgi:hypothetical protein
MVALGLRRREASGTGVGASRVGTIGRVPVRATFDFGAFISAVNSERRMQTLTWGDLADVLWDQSAELNAHRNDHPL